ncbi:MAG: ANTAR domain-containing response regulator [Oscillospiraceae bacterium]
MQEPRKSTLLFVQDAAAEPAALGAFAAEQPALALVTADGLDEAERKLAQLDPALVVWQCDAPGLPALRQCVRLAEGSEAVFLLLVRPGTYEAVWRFVQAAGICVMSWPAPQEVFRQTLRNLLLLKKSLRAMQEKTDQLQSQLQDMKRIQKAKSLLMNQLGMSEADAHRWIEKAAMDRCVKKREIAETIIRMYAL